MTHQAVNELDRARGRMAGDFRAIISDGEDLLKAVATASGAGLSEARARFEKRLKNAAAALADASQPVIDRTRQGAADADDYVRANAWSAVAVAVAAGALIGFLLAKR